MTYPRLQLKRLCSSVGRGGKPTYADGPEGDAMVVGQSCQRPGGRFDARRARAHEGPLPAKGRLRGDEVLVNSTGTGTLGRVVHLRGLPDDGLWFADTHVTVVRVDRTRVDPRFLAFVLGSAAFRRYADEVLSAGATKQRELSVELLRRERVPAPPLELQVMIADRLEAEQRRVADLDRRLEEAVAAVTEEVESVRAERFGALAAPKVPLAAAVEPGRPIVYGIVLPGEPVTDGVLLVKGGNVERGELLPEHLVRVRRDIEARYARARIAAGDLLVTIRGSYGAVAQVPGPTAGGNITQDTARVAPAAHVDGRYLLHALRSTGAQRQMAARVRGASVKGLNIHDLRRVKVPLPERAEQERIARELDQQWARRDACCAGITALRATLRQYFEALVVEATTGVVDVRALRAGELRERLDAEVDRQGVPALA